MSKTKKVAKKMRNPVLSEKLLKNLGDQDRLWIWKRLRDACLFDVFPVERKLELAFTLIRGIRFENIPPSPKTKRP